MTSRELVAGRFFGRFEPADGKLLQLPTNPSLLDILDRNRYNALRCSAGDAMDMKQWTTQFRKGLIDLCVMAVLRQQEAYGYQIVEQLSRVPGLEITESTVYPVLARMARDRYVTIRTAPSPAGPPRRYYRLSSTGRQRLSEMLVHWKSMQNSVNQLTEGAFS